MQRAITKGKITPITNRFNRWMDAMKVRAVEVNESDVYVELCGVNDDASISFAVARVIYTGRAPSQADVPSLEDHLDA